jgi:5-methylcytosine-specific restriction endonuclease McrA
MLDHISGNPRDNSPENLRFLCPNCDSQNHETKGGANAGRIKTIGKKYPANSIIVMVPCQDTPWEDTL